ncbi:MAG: DUF6142 family protein [Lachnospiraceae bacterium]|jgi:hypothetical protein|nr:DUF6142 family protein [Lachnospiraceae bacterium]
MKLKLRKKQGKTKSPKSKLDNDTKKRNLSIEEIEKMEMKKKMKAMSVSKKGRRSLLSSIVVFFVLGLLFAISYLLDGKINIIVGFISLGLIALSIYGLYYGIQGLKEKNKKVRNAKWGIGLNFLWIVVFLILFVRGL